MKSLLVIASLAVLVVALAQASTHRAATVAVAPSGWSAAPLPAWVAHAAATTRMRFIGHPVPRSVTDLDGAKTDRVLIQFGRVAVCGGCPHPPGSEAPRGTRVWVVLDAATRKQRAFGITANDVMGGAGLEPAATCV